ncbi:MAG: BTAD domain-containing putative transcriptional regulator [Acidimicrobiales bacterium]
MEIRVLGLLEVVDAGGPVPLRGRKVRSLLAMLSLRPGSVVSADRLVEGLWGEKPPTSAASTLQVYVSHLRKALGVEVVRTRSPGYVLAVDADQVDAVRFERLVAEGRSLVADDPASAIARLSEALGLWRGPALADFSFEDFFRPHIARLEELRLVATEDRTEAELVLGHHGELVGPLRALVDDHPLRERLWGQLILALYRSGRQAEALRAFSELRKLLGEELGIEPGPALRELEADVLAQNPALLAPRRPPTGSRVTMPASVEIRGAGPPELFALDRERITIGRGDGNDVCLRDDRLVSAFHAVIEFYGASFTLRDLGSSNGTYVNGNSLIGERALRGGDEIRLGRTVLLFRDGGETAPEGTERGAEAPDLTARERQVLIALCRPMLHATPFAQPASIAQIAEEIGVEETEVKFHLTDLYDKFAIYDTSQSRRFVLANEAILRRAVTLADLRPTARPDAGA